MCVSRQSGTVGQPKGVMISHDVFTWTAEHGSQCANFHEGEDSIVSYLPLCHGAAQIVDVYASLRAACTIYFAQPDALKVGGCSCRSHAEVRAVSKSMTLSFFIVNELVPFIRYITR